MAAKLRPWILAALFIPSFATHAVEREDQIVCEVSYLNGAWGYQHSGVYIDPKGSIGEFNYSTSDSRWAPNRGQPMTQEDLRQKYRPSNRIIGKVCPDQMVWLRKELEKVRYSPVSTPTHSAFDAGMQSTQCWMFKSDTEPGQNVRLRETGDFEAKNTAEAAPALANWIEAVVTDARNNVHIPMTQKGCIAYPESLNQQYDETIQQSEDDRIQAMKILTSAEGLRCRMGDGHWFAVHGTNFEQRPTPENFEMNYFQLDIETGEGRLADGSNVVQKVKFMSNVAGVSLEDRPMDGQEMRTTTVVPYKIGGQIRFPAVQHEVMYDSGGMVTTTYMGTCTVIPRT